MSKNTSIGSYMAIFNSKFVIMKLIIYYFIFHIFCSFDSVILEKNELTARQVFDKMVIATDAAQKMTYRFKALERFGSRQQITQAYVKLQCKPYKVYMKLSLPVEDNGVELLYVPSLNKKAIIHPNGFPFITVSLDPNHELLRKKSHHSVGEAGFDYIISVLKNNIGKDENLFDKSVKLDGTEMFDAKICYKMIVTSDDYKILNYTGLAGETILSIAKKKYLPEHKIMELNNYKDINETIAGRKIKIPSHYAKEAILYIDKNTFLPLVNINKDEYGVFQKYEIYDININPSFANDEFSEDCNSYGF